MNALTIQMPDSLFAVANDLARKLEVPVESLVVTAMAEKASAMLGVEFLEERASRASTEAFKRIMAKAPKNAPTDPGDEWE